MGVRVSAFLSMATSGFIARAENCRRHVSRRQHALPHPASCPWPCPPTPPPHTHTLQFLPEMLVLATPAPPTPSILLGHLEHLPSSLPFVFHRSFFFFYPSLPRVIQFHRDPSGGKWLLVSRPLGSNFRACAMACAARGMMTHEHLVCGASSDWLPITEREFYFRQLKINDYPSDVFKMPSST